MEKNRFIYWIVLLLIIIMLNSCKLNFKEDNDYFVPAYRTEKLSDGRVEISVHKRYFVENFGWRNNVLEFKRTALDMICQAINDSIPITHLYFTFAAGTTALFSEDIADYEWNVTTPNKITVRKAEEAFEESFYFDCKMSFKYRQK